MSTIKTLTGIDFDYINPTIDMYNIKDVAYGLSYEKRYGNQTNPLFSVGKHSLFVSYLMERFDGKDNQNMNAFAGLIHDLSEYLLRDLPAGVKHLDLLAGYRTLENTIQEVGYQAFGVDKTKVNWKVLHIVDLESRNYEKMFLRGEWIEGFILEKMHIQVFKEILKLTSLETEIEFIARFLELKATR